MKPSVPPPFAENRAFAVGKPFGATPDEVVLPVRYTFGGLAESTAIPMPMSVEAPPKYVEAAIVRVGELKLSLVTKASSPPASVFWKAVADGTTGKVAELVSPVT